MTPITARRPTPRQAALFGALALSLLATAWVAREDAAEPEAVSPRRAPRAGAVAPTGPQTGPQTATGWPAAASAARAAWPALDDTARAAWGEAARLAAAPAPAAPAEPPEEPPPPPTAPPFPYQLVGRLTDTRPRAILNNALRSAVVGVGEVVDGQWRVEAIESTGLRLTYLPLGQAQFVPFASPAA